jgi:hypothetical protein
MHSFISLWIPIDPSRGVLCEDSISNPDPSYITSNLHHLAYRVGNLSDWENEVRIVESFDQQLVPVIQ